MMESTEDRMYDAIFTTVLVGIIVLVIILAFQTVQFYRVPIQTKTVNRIEEREGSQLVTVGKTLISLPKVEWRVYDFHGYWCDLSFNPGVNTQIPCRWRLK